MQGSSIFILETSSARMREMLREACEPLGTTCVFASASVARAAWSSAARPTVLIVAGAPIDLTALAWMHECVHRTGVPALVCVEPAQLQAALGAGALDGFPRSPEGVAQLAQRVRGLQTRAQLTAAASLRPTRVSLKPSAPSAPASLRAASIATGCKLIAIGASTGGTEAISFLLSRLPLELPGIVIVQHMPGSHTGVFAERLDGESEFRVCEARDGARVEPGTVLIAPGGSHARVALQGGAFGVVLSAAPPPEPAERIRRADQRHVPSVDVLFESVARSVGAAALGVILTGMGDDGALGLLSLRRAGAHTLAQDEASCVVYGMPRRAVELDAASEIVNLQDMPERIAARCL